MSMGFKARNFVNNGFIGDEMIIHYKDSKYRREKLSHKRKSEISEEIVDRIVKQTN